MRSIKIIYSKTVPMKKMHHKSFKRTNNGGVSGESVHGGHQVHPQKQIFLEKVSVETWQIFNF